LYRLVDGVRHNIDVSIKYNKNEKIYFNCENCNKAVSMQFRSWKKINICGKCRRKITHKNTIKVNGQEILKKRKKTTLERYGVEHVLQSKEIKEKIKQTNLDRYGVEYISQSKEIKEKIKQKLLNKYGHNNCFELGKETIKKKYGVDNASKNNKVKEKISLANKKVAKDALIKRKKTCLKKYGVDSVAKDNTIREKIKQTNLEKYGSIIPGNFNSKGKILEKTFNQFTIKNIIQMFTLAM
jgi:osmotically-inducible protein OsmY